MPFFLENYSPNRVSDYKLIECVWPARKKYIANAMFKSIAEPEYLLHQLLNEGELIVKVATELKIRLIFGSELKNSLSNKLLCI